MKTIRLLLISFVVFQASTNTAFSQALVSPAFIKAVHWDSLDVPVGKDSLLYYILTNPIYDTVIPVQVKHLPSLQDEGLLAFDLPTISDTIFAKANQVFTYSEHEFTWHGDFVNWDGDMMIIEDSGDVFGYFLLDSMIFELVDLGNHTNILIKYIDTLFTEEECAVGAGSIGGLTSNNEEIQERFSCTEDIEDIRVLVLYTPDAGRKVDPIQKTKVFFEQLNTALRNSEIYFDEITFVPSGIFELSSIDETPSIGDDLNTLRLNEDAIELKEETGSDLVVLYTDGNYDENRTTGNAYISDNDENWGNSEFGFAIVEADGCIKYTFPHEIAHTFGCRHELDHSQEPDYATGHYWTNNGKKRITILTQVGSSNGKRRILHFSNPDVDYDGHETGTADFHDNARQLTKRG